MRGKYPRELIPAIDRVLARVERITESGCWIFMGAMNEAGYGIVGLGGRGSPNDRAHRITYRHFVGEIPDGLFVCHRCDVPTCCNPHHLFIGTAAENTADMRRKNRHSNPPRNNHDRGEYRYNAKLTEDNVREIRAARAAGQMVKPFAAKFGVCLSVISKIARGETWRHVK